MTILPQGNMHANIETQGCSDAHIYPCVLVFMCIPGCSNALIYPGCADTFLSSSAKSSTWNADCMVMIMCI